MMILRFILWYVWSSSLFNFRRGLLRTHKVLFYLWIFVCFLLCFGLIFRLYGGRNFSLCVSQLNSRGRNKLPKREILELSLVNLDCTTGVMCLFTKECSIPTSFGQSRSVPKVSLRVGKDGLMVNFMCQFE